MRDGLDERLARAADLMDDSWVLSHGPADYVRDYDVVVSVIAAKPDGTGSYEEGHYRVRFSHCPVVSVETVLDDSNWRTSWDDALTTWESWRAAGEPDGFVWAQGASAYPGGSFVAGSPTAREWSERFGHEMREFLLETNAYTLRLAFHDLTVLKIAEGDPATGHVTPL